LALLPSEPDSVSGYSGLLHLHFLACANVVGEVWHVLSRGKENAGERRRCNANASSDWCFPRVLGDIFRVRDSEDAREERIPLSGQICGYHSW
jgi:hypothetical protein